jgi:uncharacterized membrane protein YfcA
MDAQNTAVVGYVVVALAACGASLLTFFSGFGLGTLLAPVLMLFLPAEVAIMTTGLVHLANNLFKLSLVGRRADWSVVLRFGLPAIGAALVGAWLLMYIQTLPPWYSYRLGNRSFEITPVKVILAVLLLVFTLSEFFGSNKPFNRHWLPVGGLLSGFFGGLIGIQGAMRTAFLSKLNLSKDAFVATGVVVSTLIDLSRLTVYVPQMQAGGLHVNRPLLLIAAISAITGAFTGFRLLKKMTLQTLKRIVVVLLLVFAIALGLGLTG